MATTTITIPPAATTEKQTTFSPKQETSEKDLYEKSWEEKLSYIFSIRFILILLLGQILSFCITATSVTTQKLAIDYGANFPTTQNLFNYILLCVVFTGITIWKLALVDVEGNYFVVKAYTYTYTTILSAMLLDAWTIPVVVALKLTDIVVDTGDQVKGDLFCLLGATFYVLSNVGEEYLVRQFPFSFIIRSILERKELHDNNWTGGMVGLIIAYLLAMFVLYMLTPVLFRKSSAAFFNISLLTSDFYTLSLGLRLFDLKMYPLYPLWYSMIILGCVIYYVYPATQPKIKDKQELEIENTTLENNEKESEVVEKSMSKSEAV
ncbi:1607_t:CDS:2 [Ambispora gerdemannii]|uniref:1607_t:CDS:1 n=1 Tax=Ambispora gerdemannii TaxID=144530 RepID=A0A9N9ATN9_9GLOM|nr:1607_t:CDS:2 [Ambispora gerdemannii]